MREKRGGKGKKKDIQLQGKDQKQTTWKVRNAKKHLQRKLFKKVKRLHNLSRHVCASGGRNKCIDETMGGGGGGEMESIHSSV